MRKNHTFTALVATLLVLVALPTLAKTRDGETPANEGICDDLAFATPGLYGLCTAFCEAQDCEPDFAAEDPFADCTPPSIKLLDLYNRKKQPSDPEMPCVQQTACPCWMPEDLNGLRFPSSQDAALCAKDQDTPSATNVDFWRILRSDAVTGEAYDTWVASVGNNEAPSPMCVFRDTCSDGDCLGSYRFLPLTAEQFAACETQVAASGADRGFECFVP
jgi:hypothetical protein